MLNVLLKYIERNFDQLYLQKLYRAIFATAYYGMFRIGEITLSPHVIKAINVHIAQNKKKMLFLLRSSKTHGQNVKPQMVKVAASGKTNQLNGCCPFQILRDYLKVRKGFVTLEEQFFVLWDRSPVTPINFRTMLKKVISEAGFDNTYYSSHSFRGGRSVDLFNNGISINNIRKLGKWSPRSTAVYSYLKFQ